MISNRSRYSTASVGVIDGSRGPVVTILPTERGVRVFSFTYLTLTQGDRVDLIAKRVYGDETMWWRIADANPEILDWTFPPVGAVLRIPSAG